MSFYSVSSGIDHVGPKHLQTWLKTGPVRDPTVGVLHLFYGDFRTRDFEIDKKGPSNSVSFQAESEGIVFRKRARLDDTQPVLTLEFEAVNRGESDPVVQFESFFNWTFGPTTSRRNVSTLLQRHGTSTLSPLPPYGSMDGCALDIDGGTLALCDVDHNETLRIVPDANWQRFAIYQMAGSWRGPYSPERSLASGETFRATLRLELSSGCEALKGIPQATEPSGEAPPPKVVASHGLARVKVCWTAATSAGKTH